MMLTITTGCRIRSAELWCRSPDQRDWNPVVQGRCLPRWPHLPGHLCSYREPTSPDPLPSPNMNFSLTCHQLQFIAQVFQEKRALETVGISVVAKAFETIGLATFLTWWGTRTNPFE